MDNRTEAFASVLARFKAERGAHFKARMQQETAIRLALSTRALHLYTAALRAQRGA